MKRLLYILLGIAFLCFLFALADYCSEDSEGCPNPVPYNRFVPKSLRGVS